MHELPAAEVRHTLGPRHNFILPSFLTSFRVSFLLAYLRACLLTSLSSPAAEVDAVLGYDRTVFVPSSALTLASLETATRSV